MRGSRPLPIFARIRVRVGRGRLPRWVGASFEQESQMATTTQSRNGNGRSPAARAELRTIPLSQIVVKEGFNPRGEVVEDDELRAMAQTMREHGCLQSIRVQAASSASFELILGERRYRAAMLADLTEIPALVVPRGTDPEADQLELLTEDGIENEVRSDLDPLQRARGFQAMIDCGLNVRGVAERLGGGTKRASREKRIREHLSLLALPEDLRKQVGAGEVPLTVVKALVELCGLHEDLARAATEAVLEDTADYTWGEVRDEPLVIALAMLEDLPSGLFMAPSHHPINNFTLTEKAAKDLVALEKLRTTLGSEPTRDLLFGSDQIEQAQALGAAHATGGHYTLIVGQDVVDQIASDVIAADLKKARATQRRIQEEQREQERNSGASTADADSSAPGEPSPTAAAPDAAEQARDEARETRKRETEKREAAATFNESLGLLCFKHLPKLKVDERVLRILASVKLASDLPGIATRGARLGFPGWFEESPKGKARNVYLDSREAGVRATQFLAAAESAGEIAGRAITLIALASLVDEEAIAMSRRSVYGLTMTGPFSRLARRDLNAIVRERIKEGQLERLDAILAERLAEDKQDAALEVKERAARARLKDLKTPAELTDKQLERAVADAELAFGKYNLQTLQFASEVSRRAVSENTASEAKPEAAAA
jgi:ParB/RepB/Spo0J family partition protein